MKEMDKLVLGGLKIIYRQSLSIINDAQMDRDLFITYGALAGLQGHNIKQMINELNTWYRACVKLQMVNSLIFESMGEQ